MSCPRVDLAHPVALSHRQSRSGDNVQQLAFSSAAPMWRQLPAQWIAGFIVTFIMGSGAALSSSLAEMRSACSPFSPVNLYPFTGSRPWRMEPTSKPFRDRIRLTLVPGSTQQGSRAGFHRCAYKWTSRIFHSSITGTGRLCVLWQVKAVAKLHLSRFVTPALASDARCCEPRSGEAISY